MAGCSPLQSVEHFFGNVMNMDRGHGTGMIPLAD